RRFDAQAGFNRAGNGLGLTAFFGADAGIGARRVDQRNDGQAKMFGHVHQALGLAVALGSRHAEIVPDAAFGIAAFFMTENDAGAAAETPEPADQRVVFAEIAIAGERREVLDEALHVIFKMRTLLMAGDLHLLLRRQLAV